MKRRQIVWVMMVLLALVCGIVLTLRVRTVSGTVHNSEGQPLADAVVRVKTTSVTALTDAEGHFTLSGFAPAFRLHVTAWEDGYYVAGANVFPWDTDIDIVLSPYTVADNHDYEWIPSAVEGRSDTEEWLTQTSLSLAAQVSFNQVFLPLASRMSLGCRDCHGQTISDQWEASAHALGNSNERFLTMYNGTDLHGNQSPPTRFAYSRDYGSFPLRPDTAQPYYGPGYKLDFPDTAGNCAACHLPAAAIGQAHATDPNLVAGIDAQGSHCDFCHKIADIQLDPVTGLPYVNRSGVLSIEFMRPSTEPQIFFGPYDDVDVGPDTYLPLMKQSEICAACHQASFWGVPIYESFAEWQASPYPEEGQTCQTCHMRPDGVTSNFAPGRGGVERDPDTLPTHSFPGASDETLLQNAATMTVSAEQSGGQIMVTVTITNDRTGHHLPTDSPLRHLILLVQATDSGGGPLRQMDGPTVPDWGGTGDTAQGYYAGLPGTAYAKVLQEMWTEVYPTGAYWNPTRILSDNRIPAMDSDTTSYVFAAPGEEPVTIEATLLFRRAFIELMDQKGWDVPDIVMAHQSIILAETK